MLTGILGAGANAPFIEARLIVPRLDVGGSDWFLVDTGADETLLSGGDALRLRLDPGKLLLGKDFRGIGGVERCFEERAILVFTEQDGAGVIYTLALNISPATAGMRPLPSLLGRDIISRWRMTYDPPRGRVTFVVASADFRTNAPGTS